MNKIIITSDLHCTLSGQLTPPDVILEMKDKIVSLKPDVVILGGDIGHPLFNFEKCLDLFHGIAPKVGVICGNHDIWRNNEFGSEELWNNILPKGVSERGFIWLETDSIQSGKVGIVGSMVWYDYSSLDSSIELYADELSLIKGQYVNDGNYIDWHFDDQDFANKLGKGFIKRIKTFQDDDSIADIVVVTHMPLLECQIHRKPQSKRWSISNAYFGNLTLGSSVIKFSKVRWIISGHTHIKKRLTVSRNGMKPLEACMINSKYGSPGFITIEI